MNERPDDKLNHKEESPTWHLGSKNYFLLILGIALLVVGFLLLYLVDPRAENIFGILAPVFIISAYISIFFALLIEDRK